MSPAMFCSYGNNMVSRIISKYIPYFFDLMLRLLFISLLVLCGYYSRAATIRWRCLFLWKARRRLNKVHMSETVKVARHCQQYTQPLSPVVSHENDSYNTNSSSASVVTIVRNHSHTCAHAMFTSRGYYSRAAFIKSFRLCGDYSRAAAI